VREGSRRGEGMLELSSPLSRDGGAWVEIDQFKKTAHDFFLMSRYIRERKNEEERTKQRTPSRHTTLIPMWPPFQHSVTAVATGFLLFIHTRMRPIWIMAAYILPGFPVRSPRGGGTLQAPVRPPPRPVPRRYCAHQGNHKGKDIGKSGRPVLPVRRSHEGGRGQEQRPFLPGTRSSRGPQLPRLRLPFLFSLPFRLVVALPCPPPWSDPK